MEDQARKLWRIYAILDNEKMTWLDRVIFLKMERMYDLRSRHYVHIQPWRIAQELRVSRQSVSRFLTAMHEAGYMDYQVTRKVGLVDGRTVYDADCIVAELERCNYPQDIDLLNTPKQRENRRRRKCKERVHCQSCGSVNVRIEVRMICELCGEVQGDDK